MLTRFLRCLWVGIFLLIPCIGLAESNSESLGLPLYEAVSLALEHHPDVKQAGLSLLLAELELEAAWARSTVPSIGLQVNPPDLSAGGLAEDIQGTLGVGVSLPWGTQSSLSADLKLCWNRATGEWDNPGWGIAYAQRLDLAQLDAGSEQLAAKQQAVTDAQSALEQARNTIVLDTIEAYSDLLSARALLVQAQADLKQAEADLARMQEQVEAGIKGEASLLEAELALLDAQITLEQVETTYATDKETFGRVTLGIREEFEPVAFALPLSLLTQAAAEMVIGAEIPEEAITDAPEVQAALERVADAKEALRAAQADALPELSIQAGIDEGGWKVSWGISFDLFEPDRFLEMDIAAANVDLAEVQLENAQERTRNSILNQQAALGKSLEDLERLPLEEAKWALEERVMQTKFEAGAISEQDWEEFLDRKRSFDLSKDERATSLLLAYLAYRDGLGLKLEWEEWLQ